MANPQPTTGDGSDIGNKKKKKENKTPKEDDRDDDDEPTSPPQTLKADKKKTSKESDSAGEEETDDLDDSVTAMSLQDQSKDERTWTDWTFAGLNVRSWLAKDSLDKINAVRQLIASEKLDILVIGESWLNENKSAKKLKIDNFSYVRFDRTDGKAAGGLIIYIHRVIQFSVASFHEWSGEKLNVQYVELAIRDPFRFDLVAIYSPPNDPAKRLVQKLMDAFLKRSKERDMPVMFIGDLNIARERNGRNLDPVPVIQHLNLDKHNRRKVGELFEKFQQRYGARALITDPTCNSKTSTRSCVDHIITNIHQVPIDTDVKVTDSEVVKIPQNISDHSLIWCRVDRTSVPTAPDTAQSKNYLLRWNNNQWQMTEINSEGIVVGKPSNLSCRAEFINTHIDEISKPMDESKVKCAVNGCTEEFDTYDSADEHEHEEHFPCHECFEVLTDKTAGRRHMEDIHQMLMCKSPECNYWIFTDGESKEKHERDCKKVNPPSKATK